MRGSHAWKVDDDGYIGSIPACAGQPVPKYRLHIAAWVYPRVRGSPQLAVRQHYAARSIPACAGQPRLDSSNQRGKRVYPRVCGAAQQKEICKMGQSGLSPRVRGSPRGALADGNCLWSIPACAGQPTSVSG